MDKIRIVVYKNIHNPTDGKPLLIDPKWNKEQLLTNCSEALGIKAKKMFNEKGNQLSSVDKLTDGTVLYISQGESFQVKTTSQTRINKNLMICMLGTAAVGKSAVTQRFVTNKFLKDYDPTIEDCYKKTITVDGECVPLSIMDTAGMEDYYPLIDDWIDKKDGFLLLYNVEWRDSMYKLTTFIEKILHRYPSSGSSRPVIIIAGNKIDCPTRMVTLEEGREFAKKWDLKHFEISAATGTGVEEAYLSIIRELLSRRVTKVAPPPSPWYLKCDLL
jgi:GTPase KRas protein